MYNSFELDINFFERVCLDKKGLLGPGEPRLPFCFINTLSASSVSPFSQSESVNSTTLQQQFWTKIIFLLSSYNLEWPTARGQTISITAQF